MTSLSALSLSGMNAAQSALGAAAHNIANMATAGFRREQVTQTAAADGGVTTSRMQSPREGNALEADLVGLLAAKNHFLANLAVFRTNDRMMGALLDTSS